MPFYGKGYGNVIIIQSMSRRPLCRLFGEKWSKVIFGDISNSSEEVKNQIIWYNLFNVVEDKPIPYPEEYQDLFHVSQLI